MEGENSSRTWSCYQDEVTIRNGSLEYKLIHLAIDTFTKARSILIKLFGERDAKVGMINYQLGSCYLAKEKIDVTEAEFCLKKSLEIGKLVKKDKKLLKELDFPDKELIASSHKNLGWIYLKQKKYKEALPKSFDDNQVLQG